MGIRGITMITVQVRDFERMVTWYRDVLGLAVVWKEPGEFCALAMTDGGPVLALATDHPDRIADRPGTGWTPNLKVDDLDATVAQLRDAGVELDAAEEGADEGYRLVRVRDPEGNAIGLTT
jgi:catechol 2,3-dioxygenase-like lactoylglutathione lyase family enzyme